MKDSLYFRVLPPSVLSVKSVLNLELLSGLLFTLFHFHDVCLVEIFKCSIILKEKREKQKKQTNQPKVKSQEHPTEFIELYYVPSTV